MYREVFIDLEIEHTLSVLSLHRSPVTTVTHLHSRRSSVCADRPQLYASGQRCLINGALLTNVLLYVEMRLQNLNNFITVSSSNILVFYLEF